MKWRVLDTGSSSAQQNMEIDRAWLETLDEPILHFYDWKQNSITYGHFIDPNCFLNLEHSSKWQLDLARRPTGGGITFHLTDFAFSVLIPEGHEGYHVNVMENYAYINSRVAKAISNIAGTHPILHDLEMPSSESDSQHFCSAKPTKFDVMYNGKKVGGGAQRRTKRGYLHQGTIFLTPPQPEFLQDLVVPSISECISLNSHYLFEDAHLTESRQLIKTALQKIFLQS